jgi:transcriptional regulator with XRE-family HTH domain
VWPVPKTAAALARGLGMNRDTVLHVVCGEHAPGLFTLLRMSRELRISVDAVARACEAARERERKRRAVEAVRRAAG